VLSHPLPSRCPVPGATAGSSSSVRRVPLLARPAVSCRRVQLLARPAVSRRGVTIIEVLFAILVVVVGLFGALALLPAAVAQARKARTAEALAVAGMSGVHEFDARGMRKTSNWMRWNSVTSQFVFEPVNALTGIPTASTASYCIDPRMIAASNATPALATAASIFPYTPVVTPNDPRMLRISLWDGINRAPQPQQPMSRILADSIFSCEDDLSYIRNEGDKTLEAYQQWDRLPADSAITNPFARRPARRQAARSMSWLATVVPKIDRYSARATDTYVLSLVVFNQRPSNLGLNPATGLLHVDPIGEPSTDFPDLAERVVNVADMPGIGVTGGEVLLTSRLATSQIQAEEELRLRPNDWIMLSGVMSTTSGNVFRFQWYRVSDTEAEVTYDTTATNWQRYVTLVGRDWDVVGMPAPTNVQAVICQGVIGVYEKTIKLESGL
jgi:type II secretory pathway pseudopilin PulG